MLPTKKNSRFVLAGNFNRDNDFFLGKIVKIMWMDGCFGVWSEMRQKSIDLQGSSENFYDTENYGETFDRYRQRGKHSSHIYSLSSKTPAKVFS